MQYEGRVQLESNSEPHVPTLQPSAFTFFTMLHRGKSVIPMSGMLLLHRSLLVTTNFVGLGASTVSEGARVLPTNWMAGWCMLLLKAEEQYRTGFTRPDSARVSPPMPENRSRACRGRAISITAAGQCR